MRLLQTSLRIVALLSVALLARAEGPPPEPAAALVVGNSAYSYAPLGKNPDNGRYKDTVRIVQQVERYKLNWRIGSTSYQGSGTLAGNLLIVDWGSSTPVVYALAAGALGSRQGRENSDARALSGQGMS